MYLNVDILLVSCVFETFRKESLILFDLDLAYYLSTPGYSWDPMLRFTDANLKPISNTKRYQFIENTIRVGIFMICRSYVEANNKFQKPYDTNETYSIYHLLRL